MLGRIWVAVLVFSAVALGQNPVPPPMDPNANGQTGNPGTATSGSNTNSSGTRPNSNSGSNSAVPRIRADVYSQGLTGDSPRGSSASAEAISGRVVLSDGAEPGTGITVQRVCGLTVIGEAHTDSSGRFTIARVAGNGSNSNTNGLTNSAVWGCELRAALSGYQTGIASLSTSRSGDNSNIVIVLRPAGPARSLTISATTLLAPTMARKSYEKGLEAVRRGNPDLAQKDFAAAVKAYPRYAAGWLELGKVYEQRGHGTLARDAYQSAIAADPQYLFPYERLYRMDVREFKWKDAADTSGKVLRLDPYEFSEAFYFNAVSNLELNQLDAAEHSAREAARLEGSQAEPRGNYVLGAILWRKGDLAGAEEKMQEFLAASPGGPEQTSAQKMLADIEAQRARRQAREAAGR